METPTPLLAKMSLSSSVKRVMAEADFNAVMRFPELVLKGDWPALARMRPLIFAGLTFAAASPIASDVDAEALRALYEAARGTAWVRNTNWLAGEPCGGGQPWNVSTLSTPSSAFEAELVVEEGATLTSWYGIFCSRSRVAGV